MGTRPDKRIKDFIKKVRKKYSVEKALLFGSRARGDNLKYSDYDVIIVSDDFEGIFFTKRISMMYDYWDYLPLEIEPLCYTSREFEIKKGQIGIVSEALKEGVEV